MVNMTLFSAILVLSSTSWAIIWLLLEVNTLAFCTMLATNNATLKEKDSSMKYFLVQSMASSMILMFSMQSSKFVMSMAVTTSALIKIGATPFHSWFMIVNEKLSWTKATLLMTWQKVIPIYLISYSSKMIIIAASLACMVVGTTSMYTTKKVLNLIAFSTISNLPWMMTAAIMNKKILVLFMGVYFINMIMLAKWMTHSNTKTMEEMSSSENPMMMTTMLASLAGLPPMMGFIPKWMLVNEMNSQNMMFMVMTLLMMTTLNTYIYMRMISKQIMAQPQKKTTTKKTEIAFYLNLLLQTTLFIQLMK